MKQETCSIPQTEPVTPKLETIRVQLPGRIVGAEGENVVRIEVCIGGPSLIRLSSLDECCSGSLNQPEIDELLHRLERMAGCEVFKSMIRIG